MKKNQGGYVPPAYIPLGQSDSEEMSVPLHHGSRSSSSSSNESNQMQQQQQQQAQWSSGICACCDDMPSCMLLPFTLSVTLI
ncbi:hypothetical protein L195_g022377 [Trifolium pratense]|uniref:Uncharacterized protein n=1 Tax=Trifolium pratense TaxID=57577 RepID=A0A2K3N7U2_TRIPR|nr:hypothetical protein L195_g022377 [Trifolium pratense]